MPHLRRTRSAGTIVAALCWSLACILAGSQVRSEDAASVAWPTAERRLEIKQSFGQSEIVVGISSRTAGAIDSLTWGGRQFINAHDHGRELQSAAAFDDYGECLNPTEAGSNRNGTGEASTSRLLSIRSGAHWLQTSSQMAFWLEPNETTGFCTKGPGPYANPLSDYTLAKRVDIGTGGVDNAIAYQATFHLPRAHGIATFEVLTGYMPPEFSRFWTYDPRTKHLAPLSDDPGEQSLPVILATDNGSHAMGVYSPDLPQASDPGAGYGRFRFAQMPGPGNATVKWNCVFRERSAPPGDRTYTCLALVGTLEDVGKGIAALYQTHHPASDEARGRPPGAAPEAMAGRVAQSQDGATPRRGEALFVGTQANCNAGVVSTNPEHMACATVPIGSTAGDKRENEAPLYVGTTPGVNAGVVTTNPLHLNGRSRPIGFLPLLATGGTPLFSGEEPGCNAGIVSTNPHHLNCATREIGTTLR